MLAARSNQVLSRIMVLKPPKLKLLMLQRELCSRGSYAMGVCSRGSYKLKRASVLSHRIISRVTKFLREIVVVVKHKRRPHVLTFKSKLFH